MRDNTAKCESGRLPGRNEAWAVVTQAPAGWQVQPLITEATGRCSRCWQLSQPLSLGVPSSSARCFSIHCRAARPPSTVARAACSSGAGMSLMREGKA